MQRTQDRAKNKRKIRGSLRMKGAVGEWRDKCGCVGGLNILWEKFWRCTVKQLQKTHKAGYDVTVRGCKVGAGAVSGLGKAPNKITCSLPRPDGGCASLCGGATPIDVMRVSSVRQANRLGRRGSKGSGSFGSDCVCDAA